MVDWETRTQTPVVDFTGEYQILYDGSSTSRILFLKAYIDLYKVSIF